MESSTPAGWYQDPDDSASLRYWDGAHWTDHRAPAYLTPAPREPKPLAGFAWLAIVPLAFWAVSAVVFTVFAVNYITTLGPSATLNEINDAQDAFQAARITMVLLGLPGAFLLIPWFYRAYVNIEAAGARLRFDTGWSVGAWFIPIFNFIRCKQIVNDIWRGSPLDDGLRQEGWTARPYPSWLNQWWAIFILSGIVFAVGEVILGINSGHNLALADAYTDERRGAVFEAIGAALYAVNAILTIAVVRAVTVRQDSAIRGRL